MSASDFLALNVLNRNLADPDTPIVAGFLGLATAAPLTTDTGSTVTEATYGSYARVALAAADFGAAASRAKTNTAALKFPQATSGSNVITHWFRASASTAGDLYEYGMCIVPGTLLPGIAVSFPAGSTLYVPEHGFIDDDRVSLIDHVPHAFPSDIDRDQAGGYYVVNQAGDTFQISTTSGGAALSITTGGHFLIAKPQHRTVTTLYQPEFAVGELIFLM